ncbi:MAG TPA: transcription antitermination factor NusB [Actinotalea caeni]|uniref:RsmB/NOP family class I SAM-dependent RNA methyltransferase n=1 Tax=Actinotalea caeni TaxID=1348467 RepID=UPI002B4B2AFA|nr:transcription antitermination factor NusB [Actinotalea caeni]HLV56538.1 transcription antitermination factor NusB [Actinotalea caeni]
MADRDRHGRGDGSRDDRRRGDGDRRGRGGPPERGGHARGTGGERSHGGRDSRPRGGSRSRPSERSRGTDPARRAAFDTLRAVADSDSYANLVLPPMLAERGIRGRDAAFATELAYGTLRLRGRYDAVIALAGNRRPEDVDAPLLDVLRLGVHQILGMRVPDHAAVSETVGLARSVCGTGPSQLVNAVLRRVAEQDLDAWLEAVAAAQPDDVERLAAVHSHPGWVVRALRQGLAATPPGADDLTALLEADNAAPAVTLVARPGLVADGDVPADAAPGRWASTARILAAGDPGALPGVREGRLGVQDEGSQLVALALASAPLEGTDTRWLDLCAGPGGKAALLAALLAERAPDGELVANEVSAHRARLVERAVGAAAERVRVEVRVGDGREVGAEEAERYDRVLVDVPCTGLGALRRRPESRWRRSPSDLAALGPLQRDLLRSAIAATRPGGLIGYVTCSPHLAETRLVVEDVVKKAPAEVLDATAAVAEVALAPLDDQRGPFLQLWPHRHGTDAMFLALLRRT